MGCCKSVIDSVKSTLQSDAVKQGLEELIKRQDHFRNTFMDFATVAIFFSSISATTLQFSYASTNTSSSWTIVNLCWFASLVLSIASATSSFLGAIVHQSPEHLRRSKTSGINFRILSTWFRVFPSALLTFSGILFLIGVCAFTFASSQGRAIQIATTTLTSTIFLTILTIFVLFKRAFDIAFHVVVVSISAPALFLVYVLVHIVLPFEVLFFLLRFQRFPKDGDYEPLSKSDFYGRMQKTLNFYRYYHWRELMKSFV